MKKISKLNRLDGPLHIHCCLFDVGCWCEAYLYGAPLRLHRRGKSWIIFENSRRSMRMWEGVTSVPIPSKPRANELFREAMDEIWSVISLEEVHQLSPETITIATDNHTKVAHPEVEETE